MSLVTAPYAASHGSQGADGGALESVFEPLGDELFAGVDVYLPQLSLAAIDKLVWRVWRNNDDLTRRSLQRFGANHIAAATFQHDNDLFIGMFMQPWAVPWGLINPDERDAAVTV